MSFEEIRKLNFEKRLITQCFFCQNYFPLHECMGLLDCDKTPVCSIYKTSKTE